MLTGIQLLEIISVQFSNVKRGCPYLLNLLKEKERFQCPEANVSVVYEQLPS
jgi:hypothetical protein